MYIYPELPNEILRHDYLRGFRSQIFIDSGGKHQYEKRLEQIRAIQLRSVSLRQDYYRKQPNGSKLNRYVNHFLLKEFGKVLESSDLYCEFEDNF